jgi:putative ABC transport system permease protein
VVLLAGAGVLLRTLHALQGRSLGVDPEGVAAFQVHLPEVRYPTSDLRIAFHDDLHRALEAIPGVAAAGSTSHLPVTGPANTWGTRRAVAVGQPVEGDNLSVNQRIAGGRYFEAVGTRLVAGRLLDERDGPDAPQAVVVTEGLARALFGNEDPVGRLLRTGPLYPEIVGVVEDVALSARLGPGPIVFHSYAQFGAGRRWPMTQVIRMADDARVPWDAVRATLAEVDPQAVLDGPRALDEVIAAGIGDERFAAFLLQAFAGLALLLASLGLYGVLAHSVERRRYEIGVRMALGADRGTVRGMIVARGLGLTGTGLAIGLLAALGLNRVLDFLLFGVGAADPTVFVVVPAALLMVGVVASYLPARHATRVDPARSLEAG